MRRRRLLLATTALTTLVACNKQPADEREPLPANPKGSRYDAGVAVADDARAGIAPPGDAGVDAAQLQPPPAVDAGPRIIRMPANPKGSHYDAGTPKP